MPPESTPSSTCSTANERRFFSTEPRFRAESLESLVEPGGQRVRVHRPRGGHLQATRAVHPLPVLPHDPRRQPRQRLRHAPQMPPEHRAERQPLHHHPEQVVRLVLHVPQLLLGELDRDGAGLFGKRRVTHHLHDQIDHVRHELWQTKDAHQHGLPAARRAPACPQPVESVGQPAAIEVARSLRQRLLDERAHAGQLLRLVRQPREHPKAEPDGVALRQQVNGELHPASQIDVGELALDCRGRGRHQCATGLPSTGVSSLSFSWSMRSFAASMFRRSSGSVFDGRVLNHQSSY
jgi:hypothetical protein